MTSPRPEPPPSARPTAEPTAPVGALERDDSAIQRSVRRFFFGAGALALVIAALVIGKDLLMPLAFAALLAFVLDPLVERLRRWRVPQPLAVTLVILLALALLSATAALVAQQLIAVGRDLPSYQNTIQTKLRDLRGLTERSPAVADATRVIGIIEEGLAPDNAASAASAASAAAAASAPATASNRPARASRAAPAAVVVQPVEVAPAPKPALRALREWAAPVLLPLATTGLVIVLVAYLLAQRRELRDRLVRLTGGDIHHMAQVLDDAAQRVSRYLSAHLLVNIGYGLPMALGLWWLGVPGALLWGLLAALLRFVPYLGPAVGALFPLAMAFAVDPGWSMVLWTLALVLTLELVSNNVVEPLAYGTRTGVSPVAVVLSAAFWGAVWGPVGLVLATPLTVCLVVMGQHLGPLRFLHVLLGSEPAFDRPTQLYQRLISGDHEEAIAQWRSGGASSLAGFYDDSAVPALALAAAADNASPAQRHNVLAGGARLLEALREQQPPDSSEAAGPRVLCIGARNELDSLSAGMLAHALQLQGHAAEALSAVSVSPERLAALDLRGVGSVVLCSFHAEPQAQARLLARRLRRRHGGLRVVLAAWRAAADLRWPGAVEALGIDALATSLHEAVGRAPAEHAPPAEAPPPSAAPQHALQEPLARAAQQALEVFGWPQASLCWRAADGQLLQAGAGASAWALGGPAPALALAPDTPQSWTLQQGEPLVIADVARDARFPANALPGLDAGGALVSWPLRDGEGATRGVLALHDTQARDFSERDQALLAAMAEELVAGFGELERGEHAPASPAAASAASYEVQRPLPAGSGPCVA